MMRDLETGREVSDDEKIATLSSPRLSAGLLLMVGMLMRDQGLTEYTMDSRTMTGSIGLLTVDDRDERQLTVRRTPPETH